MQDFIGKLASAIAVAEGYFVANSLPSKNNNPGDLRLAPATPPSLQMTNKGFVKFLTLPSGIAALYHQLALDIARGWSMRKLVYTYAPPGDYNNSELYLTETLRRVGLTSADIDTPLENFLEITYIK